MTSSARDGQRCASCRGRACGSAGWTTSVAGRHFRWNPSRCGKKTARALLLPPPTTCRPRRWLLHSLRPVRRFLGSVEQPPPDQPPPRRPTPRCSPRRPRPHPHPGLPRDCGCCRSSSESSRQLEVDWRPGEATSGGKRRPGSQGPSPRRWTKDRPWPPQTTACTPVVGSVEQEEKREATRAWSSWNARLIWKEA